MDEVSQNGRRKHRPWTAKDQLFAEVAAACGCPLKEIGQVIGRHSSTINDHLKIGRLSAHREYCRIYREQNRSKRKETCKRYRETYPERVRDSQLRFHQSNPGAHMGYYYANHEARKAACRLYYRKNIERIRQYRHANKEKRARQYRNWYACNKHKVRQYIAINIERIRNSRREYYRRNSQRQIEISRRYSYRKRAGHRGALSPASRVGVESRFALWKNRCAFCGVDAKHLRNHGLERLTDEHVMALSDYGLDEESNIAPACKACNCSKKDHPVESWYRRQPFFTEARWRKIQRHCPAAVVGQLPLGFAA